VSFIVPALNEERYIAECIGALKAQSVPGLAEIIVVDNGSSDQTADVARRSGARVVVQPVRGLAAARQAGLYEASGTVIIYVDSDSRLADGWADRVCERFLQNPRLVAISTAFDFHDGRFVDRIGNRVFQRVLCPAVNLALRALGHPDILIGSAFAVRTDAMRRAGGMDQRFQFYGEDTMIALRLAGEGLVRYFDAPRITTSARRYQQQGILPVVFRYFIMFTLLHLGNVAAARSLADVFSGRRAHGQTAAAPAKAIPREANGLQAEIGGSLALSGDASPGPLFAIE
jgi:glycosyltransferase involved in cell wall biosynthesis